MDCSCVDYDVVLCLNTYSDGTYLLQRIHWWTNDANAKFLQICSDEETNYILNGLRVSKFTANFYFGWTINLKIYN